MNVGASALLHRRVATSGIWVANHVLRCALEQAKLRQLRYLIHAAVGVGKVTVELLGAGTERTPGVPRVTIHALAAARVVPNLLGGTDRLVFAGSVVG